MLQWLNRRVVCASINTGIGRVCTPINTSTPVLPVSFQALGDWGMGPWERHESIGAISSAECRAGEPLVKLLQLGLEPRTLGLLDPRSNQLSYKSSTVTYAVTYAGCVRTVRAHSEQLSVHSLSSQPSAQRVLCTNVRMDGVFVTHTCRKHRN